MTRGKFEYKKLTKYPHMKPEDVAIWEMFIEQNPDFFNKVDYDVHVGEGADFLPTGEDTPDGRENRLYQKKIDVVGYLDNTVFITEVKPHADFRGLGQLIGYAELYPRNHQTPRQIKKMLICRSVDKEMLGIYNKNGIAVVTVE